ncbi:hypothetical protein CUJ89_31760 [Burkholderia pyrrocinia]|uniref:Lipoprotein n=1 Tax=Burkholderia pyrrocinia TaxID=60550 RepID=A0A2Z5N7H9_BURPY|nr:hypothetical protein [Burkholderia pyrrocinia]AXF24814.1 hypothetical protein CUJ89_31760 [Burkholderia pyrrocinia]
MKAVALIALTCLALTACGGDDSSTSASSTPSNGSGSGGTGGTGGTGGPGPGSGSSGSGGSMLTLRYEALSPAADAASFLTLVNGEGAKGYRYLSDGYYSVDGAIRSIFVNDGAAQTYTYELLAAPADAASFISQANTAGAQGYRYEGPLTYGNLYRKDGGSSATFTYASAATPGSQAAFLAQANGQGQSGYWFVGPMMVGSVAANLYMKNGASNATYAYDALTPTTTVSDFIAQANSEGAKGYRAKGGMVFGSDSAWVYVKDQTQSPTFTYQSATVQTTSAGFVQQSNNLGAQGTAYLGDLALGGTASFYFKPANCTGFLCTTLNPLTQN